MGVATWGKTFFYSQQSYDTNFCLRNKNRFPVVLRGIFNDSFYTVKCLFVRRYMMSSQELPVTAQQHIWGGFRNCNRPMEYALLKKYENDRCWLSLICKVLKGNMPTYISTLSSWYYHNSTCSSDCLLLSSLDLIKVPLLITYEEQEQHYSALFLNVPLLMLYFMFMSNRSVIISTSTSSSRHPGFDLGNLFNYWLDCFYSFHHFF